MGKWIMLVKFCVDRTRCVIRSKMASKPCDIIIFTVLQAWGGRLYLPSFASIGYVVPEKTLFNTIIESNMAAKP